jgi:hypothetical protein
MNGTAIRYIGVDSYRKEEKSYSLQLKGIRPLITKLPNPTMLTANDKLTREFQVQRKPEVAVSVSMTENISGV